MNAMRDALIADVQRKIDGYSGSSRTFAEIIRNFIELCASPAEGEEKLVNALNLQPQTIRRWVRGQSPPGHHLRPIILRRIAELLSDSTP